MLSETVKTALTILYAWLGVSTLWTDIHSQADADGTPWMSLLVFVLWPASYTVLEE